MNQYEPILSKKKSVSASFGQSKKNSLSVFISYSIEDSDKIDPVVNNLKCIPGLNIFYANSSIQPGDIINQKIILAIKDSHIFIVFYSRNSVKSVYVQQEIGAAISSGKIPIPILLDDTKPVGMIANNINYLDFSDENKKYLEYNKLHQFLESQIKSNIEQRNNDFFSALLLLGIGYLALKSDYSEEYDNY